MSYFLAKILKSLNFDQIIWIGNYFIIVETYHDIGGQEIGHHQGQIANGCISGQRQKIRKFPLSLLIAEGMQFFKMGVGE